MAASSRDGGAGGAADEPAPLVEHVIAGPGRRLLGVAVDGGVWIVLELVVSVTSPFGDDGTLVHQLTSAGVVAAYEIVSVALWGRTIGKLVAGTRVVALGSGGTPGWWSAVLRWAVPSIAGLGSLVQVDGLVAGMASVVSGIVTIVVYIGVLQAPLRQGVHDKVAGTVVVLDPRRGNHPAGGASTDASIDPAPHAP